MGIGFFDGSRFHLVVSMRFAATASQLSSWELAFQHASRILHDATDGRHQIGNIYVCNNSTGSSSADFYLRNIPGTPTAGGTPGLGVTNLHITLFDEEKFRPFTVAHELGHYLYGLYDEYRTPAGGTGAVCTGAGTADACIMEVDDFTDGDQIDQLTGAIIAGAVSEFCSAGNHTMNNLQEAINHSSCWETIAIKFPHPDPTPDPPASPAPAAGLGMMGWFLLKLEQQFVLLVDRSASMAGDKLGAAQQGGDYWADSALLGDFIGVVSYNQLADTELSLTEITGIADRQSIKDALGGITSAGSTSIGNGLRRGLGLFLGADPTEISASQVMVLLSDGKHNTGEHPDLVIPDLIARGVRVFTLGIGPDIDAAMLQDISARTGGLYRRIPPALDPDQQAWRIRNALFEFAEKAHENTEIIIYLPGSTNPAVEEAKVYVEEGSELATFLLSWQHLSNRMLLELYSPSGVRYAFEDYPQDKARLIFTRGNPYMGFQIQDPEPGDWQVSAIPAGVEGKENYVVLVSSRNPQIGGSLYSPWKMYNPGQEIPLHFQCDYYGPITGLKIDGRIHLPNGETSPLAFQDDGDRESGDVLAQDGTYSTIFRNSGRPGTYRIEVTVENEGNARYPTAIEFPASARLDPAVDERPAIPLFRRTYTTTLLVGREENPQVSLQPDRGYPGDQLSITLRGIHTRFEPGALRLDFGDYLVAADPEIINERTARVAVEILGDARPGPIDVRIFQENQPAGPLYLEGGFQVLSRSDQDQKPARWLWWLLFLILGIIVGALGILLLQP